MVVQENSIQDDTRPEEMFTNEQTITYTVTDSSAVMVSPMCLRYTLNWKNTGEHKLNIYVLSFYVVQSFILLDSSGFICVYGIHYIGVNLGSAYLCFVYVMLYKIYGIPSHVHDIEVVLNF